MMVSFEVAIWTNSCYHEGQNNNLVHCIIMGKTRAMHIATGCPPNLQDEFYLTASHLHKCTLTKSLKDKTPHEAWTWWCPDYSYMHEISCKAFVLILVEHNQKIYACSIECILIGYAQNSKAYRCYEKKTRKIYETYHVKFCKSHEGHPPLQISNHPLNYHNLPTILPNYTNPAPILINNNDFSDRSKGIQPQSNTQQDVIEPGEADIAPNPLLCHSSRIPTLTAKGTPEYLPVMQVQRAVQELITAGEHIWA